MNAESLKKFICCTLAAILLFLGIGAAVSADDSSFLRAENTAVFTEAAIRSAEHNIEEPPVCTLTMLQDSSLVIRNNMTGSMMRWQNREILLFLIVGSFLQYLFYYQSAECKEDGQLFLCRSAIVDYIHLKDSGE